MTFSRVIKSVEFRGILYSPRGILYMNIEIKHGFLCINVCQVPRELLKTEAEGRGFQQVPWHTANINVLVNNV